MKYALLIFPKPGSHEALGPDEYGPVNAEYLALRDDPRITVISKGVDEHDGYSAFDHTDLAAQLHNQNVEEIVIAGLATDYCVKSSVLDALKHGFKVKAIENAMRPVDLQPGDGDRAIDEMRDAGAEVI